MSTTLDPPKETPAPRRHVTPEELLAMPDGKGYELVDGVLVERNMGAQSSWIAARLMGFLQLANRPELRAWIFDAECGYLGLGRRNSLRKPDLSVVRQERLPAIPRGWIVVAPDVAVEVVSPGDSADEIEQKVEEYLEAGTALVWVIYPEARVVQVHRREGTEERLREGDTLHGEDVLPGFACPVAELFPPAAGPGEATATERAS
jgi:Uma2 family endonuclease